ncbi:MAG: ComF family protein [Patescibacteria group bacterium]|nr:ComF family protein [Patescibacteria group bacterium]
MSLFNYFSDFLLDLVFPKKCVVCGKADMYLCPNCLKKVPVNHTSICYRCQCPSIGGFTHPRCLTRSGLDGVLIVSPYERVLKRALHLFKYRFVKELHAPLGNLLANYLQGKLYQIDMVVPVPLHQKRLNQREFNQALLLAQVVSQKFSLPLRSEVLIRKYPTSPQAELSKEKRVQNLKKAFLCPLASEVRGKNVLLVDDVATTFTTLEECCATLKKAGAAKVWAAVLAHGK